MYSMRIRVSSPIHDTPRVLQVVETVENESTQVTLADAKRRNPNAKDAVAAFKDLEKLPAGQFAYVGVSISPALTRLIEQPELRAELGRGARRRANEVGLWDHKVDRLESYYTSLRS